MASDKFLSYFHRELNYLRNAGSVFAAKNPKIARRLDWTKGETSDPHVERLLESFAFLTAQLHQNLDDRFPQIAAGLLNVLYPQLLNPLPSAAIAQFEVDPTKAKMTTGYPIPRHSPLFAYADEGLQCKFRTAYPVTLWPIKIEKAEFVQALNYVHLDNVPPKIWYLKLSLKSQKVKFADLDMDDLTIHLAGDRLTTTRLYQAIFAQNNQPVLYSTDGQNLKLLHVYGVDPVGFERDQQLLPTPSHSHPSYQFLQEYFHFPEKYLFFRINHLLKAVKGAAGDELEIFIPIEETSLINSLNVSPDNFLLGCTPIINLFHKTTDPVRLTQRQVEYRITADSRLERTHEIYALQEVKGVTDTGDIIDYAPYYSFEHGREANVYWYSRRQPSDQRNIPGTDVYIAFVNQQFDPVKPPNETIYAEALCTNRFLAEQIPAGAKLQFEGKLPVAKITCLDRPVTPAYTPHDGETLWKLVSQLSIHHLGFSDPDMALKVLKETLNLYAGISKSSNITQIGAIMGLVVKQAVRRIPRAVNDQAWMGFVRGLEVDLTIDEGIDPTGMSFILCGILRHYLAHNVAIDSFVGVNLKSMQRNGNWVTWQPLSGQHQVL